MIKTVLIVDLVGYSDVATTLEENLSRAELVADLNDQIQKFVDRGLEAVRATRDDNVIKTTGDGAILVFHAPDHAPEQAPNQAHECAVAIHTAAAKHNEYTTRVKRYFRMGAATGDVVLRRDAAGRVDIAGVTVSRAERLQTAAAAGELVVDVPTFTHLSTANRRAYQDQEEVRGKRQEHFAAHRFQVLTDIDDAFRSASSDNESRVAWFDIARLHPAWCALGVVVVVGLVWFVASRLSPTTTPPAAPSIQGVLMNAVEARESLKEGQEQVPSELEWLEELIAYREDRAQKIQSDGKFAHVMVYRSYPLVARQRLKITCHAYRRVEHLINVLAFLKREASFIPLEDTHNHSVFSLDVEDVRANDEIWILILAADKAALPIPSEFSLEVSP